MKAIRVYSEVTQNHELILRNLPLTVGMKVEVIILEDNTDTPPSVRDRFPLRGKAIRFENPFDSVSPEIF